MELKNVAIIVNIKSAKTLAKIQILSEIIFFLHMFIFSYDRVIFFDTSFTESSGTLIIFFGLVFLSKRFTCDYFQ